MIFPTDKKFIAELVRIADDRLLLAIEKNTKKEGMIMSKPKQNRPPLTKQEEKDFNLAAKFCNKDPILRAQSSAMRRSWCEGFMNGKLYFEHNQPERKWYEFWKK